VAVRRIKIGEESTPRKVFVWALDWPGWCRSGRDFDAAVEALVTAADRYAVVARAAGLDFPAVDAAKFKVSDRVVGGGATEFGVPSMITDGDRRPISTAEARKLAGLVASAWARFDEVAAVAPEVLRKGPRGGGRDTSKIVAHVNEADFAYAREMGIKLKAATDRAGIEHMRASIQEVVGQLSDGAPLAGRKWTQRYAARRIAWHALDHAWEIEDKSE
jgi:hypothetical protein